jgi:aspartate 1-decarboxylase
MQENFMQRKMLKSKIHRVTITEADLNYNGSMTIDRDLMGAAGIVPFEQVKIYNISNGERFDTYAIEGAAGSGVIGLNGAAARRGQVGDLIIIVTYALYEDSELEGFAPVILLCDENNKIQQQLNV